LSSPGVADPSVYTCSQDGAGNLKKKKKKKKNKKKNKKRNKKKDGAGNFL
jgi:hypothetical protein